MSSKIYHKGIISRSLSTGQSGEVWDNELEILTDSCTIGEQALTDANVDRRTIATGPDFYHWKYQTFGSTSPNTWLEYAWRSVAVVHSANGFCFPTTDPDTRLKVLVSGAWPMKYMVDKMEAHNIDFYWLNIFELRNMEDVMDHNDQLANTSNCTYHAVDLADLAAGEYDGFFDSARVSGRDIFTPSLNFLDKAMDSVKVGGVFLTYDISDFAALYADSLSVHEQRMHRFCRRMLNRSDYEIHHITHDEIGLAAGYRIG